MVVKEIRKIAKEMGINSSKMVKKELIRAIQVKEGNVPCYQSGIEDCAQEDCCWLADCQKQG